MKHSLRYHLSIRLLGLFALCLLSVFPSSAQLLAQNEQRTVRPRPADTYRLADIIQQLETRYRIGILFEERSLKNLRVSAESARPQATLEASLTALLQPFGLRYRKIKNNYVILTNEADKKRSSSLNSYGQISENNSAIALETTSLSVDGKRAPIVTTTNATADNEVSGIVTDEVGAALTGVSVVVKGTSRGTVTDTEGKFRLTIVDAGSVLVFSFIGYQRQELPVGSRSTFSVQMQTDDQALNEVVVVGYTTQARRDVTGSVSKIEPRDLVSVPSASFAQQLQGRSAGVQVGNDAAPGGGVAVRIRGIGSITGSNDPLYVIDGVPTQGNLNQINPNDIESLQILKDASTASIYGSRANNGVVIVTTRKGRNGAPKVSFDSYAGVQSAWNVPEFLTPQQAAQVGYDNLRNTGQVDPTTGNPIDPYTGTSTSPSPILPDYLFPRGAKEGDPRVSLDNYSTDVNSPEFGRTKFLTARANKAGTNWFEEILRPAAIQNYNLAVSGGTDASRYAVSMGYFNQQGIVNHTGFKRYSIRANTEFNVRKNIRIGENLQFSYTDDVSVGQQASEPDNPTFMALTGSALQPVYDIGGNFTGTRNFGGRNPVAYLVRNKDNHRYTTRLFGNAYAEVDVLRNLTARTSVGVDLASGNLSQFRPRPFEDILQQQVAQLTVFNDNATNLTWTNNVTYTNTFAEKHRLTFLAGTETVTNRFTSQSAARVGYNFEDVDSRYLNAGDKVAIASGSGIESSLFSVFAKADYVLADKYLFTALVRRDGSSRFSEQNRWGTFPAFSVGWRLSSEDFMQNISAINDLKLRASWGQTGNQNIDPYNRFTTFAASQQSTYYDLNGTSNSIQTGYSPRRLGNPDARWEAQTMTNIGLDATLFNNRLDISLDAYNRSLSNLLLEVPLPATGGQIQSPATNVGSMYNRGLELELTHRGGDRTKGLQYVVSVNATTFTNKITQLYGGDDTFISGFDARLTGFNRTQVGHPVASFYGYKLLGIFQTQGEADAAATQGGDRTLYNQPGRFQFADLNNDGQINSEDRTFIGSPIPKFTYGLNANLSYRSFDLTMFFQGVQGNDLFNYNKYFTDFIGVAGANSLRLLDSWTPDNTDAVLPKTNAITGGYESQPSTYYIEKGSFLRAKQMQLGYTMPLAPLQRLGVDRLRVYVQAQNLFTITKYQGIEPDVNLQFYGSGADRSIGVDRGVYPAARSFIVGLQVGF